MSEITPKKTNFKMKIPFPNVGERYKNASLSDVDFLSEPQAKNLSIWLEDPKYFLFCQSLYGVGKSFLSSAIAIFFYEKSIPVYFFNENNLFEILDAEEQEGRLASWKLEGICQNHIVVWDDFGSTLRHGKNDIRDNEKKELMFKFIDSRYEKQLPTIITSNLTIKEICETINPRISSRLAATENLILDIVGPDQRQQGK